MNAPPSRAVRLEAMLVLGRLAARNRACQQDAVREGVVPVLVEMMQDGAHHALGHSYCACRAGHFLLGIDSAVNSPVNPPWHANCI